MALKLKAFGMHLGAFRVGITELNQDWVYSKSNAPWGEPVDLDYPYILCMGFAQSHFMTDDIFS